MTADVQRELAEAYAVAVGCANDCPDCAKTIAALIPTVERAEKRAAAAALESAAREDSVSTHRFTPVEMLTLRVVRVDALLARIAALDPAGAASGETTWIREEFRRVSEDSAGDPRPVVTRPIVGDSP